MGIELKRKIKERKRGGEEDWNEKIDGKKRRRRRI
jgi:hypothetical protein